MVSVGVGGGQEGVDSGNHAGNQQVGSLARHCGGVVGPGVPAHPPAALRDLLTLCLGGDTAARAQTGGGPQL
jgi:hypothetical protein